ncbi:DUF4118 domain-containing protein [Streptantibioticus ferralitis]|uniref:DUF4118 domain-containing protein n=1 Tax=Streptantibioticus ferralitis TaxID=236510 RepID=A0ABT5YWA1_9ACTN|nr:DUF4118 domain-containing protein [Streptantibioticus ferralitis]MDF2255763.1 DUF4118 domain-containing protein [Streptantibioticus ferralitis]
MASVHWSRSVRHDARPHKLVSDLVLPLGYASAAVLAAVLELGGGRDHLWFSVAVFAVLTAVFSAQTRVVWAPAVAVVCWLFLDGFMVNSQGELAWRSTDRAGLAVLLVAALAGATTGAITRRRDHA